MKGSTVLVSREAVATPETVARRKQSALTPPTAVRWFTQQPDTVRQSAYQQQSSFTVTSHNGSAIRRSEEGRLDAFVRAYEQGYRRFQVDVVPIRGELVSMHSIFGWKWRLTKMDINTFRRKHPDVPTLNEILSHNKLGSCHWNIEAKSIKSLAGLLSSLRLMEQHPVDHSRIMVSAPFRRRLLRTVASDFPHVSLAAPVLHGGALGIRFLGARRSVLPGSRPYDCEQIWHPFLRKTHPNRPLRQGWTLRRFGSIDRLFATGAHAMVNSSQLVVRGAMRHRPPSIRSDITLSALALGGGGWRGAFGGIGTVMYLHVTKKWDAIKDVVGISGGSFAIAALSREQASVDASLKTLLQSVEAAARKVKLFVGGTCFLTLVSVAALVSLVNSNPTSWGPPWVWVFAPLVFSFVARCIVTLRWRGLLREVFGAQRLPEYTGIDRRRYVIGATGLHDGDLYAFTTDFARDAARWRDARTSLTRQRAAVPLTDASLARAVGRATSLPGLGQLGISQMWLPNCGHEAKPTKPCPKCESVPDRLIDGGISGIFGRGLMRPTHSDGTASDVLVVDAGRRLVNNGSDSVKHIVARVMERMSIGLLLARWLAVAIDVGYRDELEQVDDGRMTDGHRFWLVRLAEDETKVGRPLSSTTSAAELRRAECFQKLYALRDRVHKFSLMGANKAHANRTIVAAVAACALEFDTNPDIEQLLADIDKALDRKGELINVWNKLPLL